MNCPDGCKPNDVKRLDESELRLVEAKVGPGPSEHPISGFDRCGVCGLVFKNTRFQDFPLLIKAGHLVSGQDGQRFEPSKSD